MRIIHLFFMLLLFAGCTQDTHESIMVEMISAYEDITKVIENVSDEVSANDAIIKLDKINNKIIDLNERIDKLDEPDEEIKEKMTQYETKMKETIGKLLKTSMGIAFKPYGKQLMLSIRDMIPK